ncbi:transposable element Tcb2 transposase [Trichonephila clavipes]|nr:transposable element Tcb2 transposase [Trichonephila clavipes]
MLLGRFRRQKEQPIIGMMEAGWSSGRVARQIGRSDCVTSRREDRHIVRNARVQPNASSADIQAQVAPSLGAPVSSRIIRRRLAEGHLGSWRPLRVLPLTPTHRRLRLEWCRARGNWTAAEWNQVVFSNESRFHLSSDDNRVRVWRPRGERLNPTFALLQHTAPTAGVMVWGAIAYNTRSSLVLILRTMTTQRYVHDIQQPHVLHSCNGSQEPFYNKKMLGLRRPECHKTASALLLSFLGLSDAQIFLQSSISEIIWDGDLGIPRVRTN